MQDVTVFLDADAPCAGSVAESRPPSTGRPEATLQDVDLDAASIEELQHLAAAQGATELDIASCKTVDQCKDFVWGLLNMDAQSSCGSAGISASDPPDAAHVANDQHITVVSSDAVEGPDREADVEQASGKPSILTPAGDTLGKDTDVEEEADYGEVPPVDADVPMRANLPQAALCVANGPPLAVFPCPPVDGTAIHLGPSISPMHHIVVLPAANAAEPALEAVRKVLHARSQLCATLEITQALTESIARAIGTRYHAPFCDVGSVIVAFERDMRDALALLEKDASSLPSVLFTCLMIQAVSIAMRKPVVLFTDRVCTALAELPDGTLPACELMQAARLQLRAYWLACHAPGSMTKESSQELMTTLPILGSSRDSAPMQSSLLLKETSPELFFIFVSANRLVFTTFHSYS